MRSLAAGSLLTVVCLVTLATSGVPGCAANPGEATPDGAAGASGGETPSGTPGGPSSPMGPTSGGPGDGGAPSDGGATTTHFPAGTICNASGAPRTRPATVKHVIWIMFENKDYGNVIGSANAPYINAIKSQCGYATSYLDNVFPSDINSLSHYMAVTSGSNCNTGLGRNGTGCITDDNPPSSHTISNVSLMEQASSYKGYIESMPSSCDGTTSGAYAPKHNPPVYFQRLATTCSAHDVGLTAVSCPTTANTPCSAPTNAFTQDLANDTLPAFTFVTPNLTNDMHDGTMVQAVTHGDNWLHTYLPLVLASPAYLRGEVAVAILWDEQNTFTAGPIPNIFVSPYVQPTVSTTTFNHFAVLRTAEEQLGITTYLGCASGTPPGGVGSCPSGSTVSLRSIFNY